MIGHGPPGTSQLPHSTKKLGLLWDGALYEGDITSLGILRAFNWDGDLGKRPGLGLRVSLLDLHVPIIGWGYEWDLQETELGLRLSL